MKKWLSCGKDIPDDSIFCPFCGEEITQEKCSDNKETPTNKNDNVFKRILSWIVLIVCFELMLFLYSVIFVLAEPVLIIFNSLSTIWKYAVILLGVSSFVFGLIFLPFTVGIPFVISLSEKVCPSEKGTRYLVFGILTLLNYSLAFIKGISEHQILYSYLFFALLGIALIFYGKIWDRWFQVFYLMHFSQSRS